MWYLSLTSISSPWGGWEGLLFSLLPIAIYIVILKLLDSFTLVRWTRLAQCIAGGILACAITLGIELTLHPDDNLFPLMEEILKSLTVIWMIHKRRMVFVSEALCYGAAAGGGFALMENMVYLYYNPDMMMMSALFRGVGTALLHMGCTAFVAVMMIVMDGATMRNADGKSGVDEAMGRWGGARYALSVAGPVAIHYLYNMFLLPEFMQIVATIVLFLIIFVSLSLYNERRIYRWLDHSITFDVKLLVAIREGRLTETHTGRYLLSVKEQFHPEVFFDIICFLQLYLELLIEGKSRLLLEQEGLAPDLTAEQKQRHSDMVVEMNTLRSSIGIMGEHVLRPVLRFNKEDIMVMK